MGSGIYAQSNAAIRALANQYFRDARIYMADAAYEQSNILMRKALPLYAKLGMWSKYCSSLETMAQNFNSLELPDSVKVYQENLVTSSVKHFGKNNRFEIQGYIAISELLVQKQQYDLAMAYLREALGHVKTKPIGKEDLLTAIHANIGMVYEAQQLIDAAIREFEMAEYAALKKPAAEDLIIAKLYFAFARTLWVSGQFKKALAYAEKSSALYAGLYKPDNIKIAELQLLISEIYLSLHQNKEAKEAVTKAFGLLKKVQKSILTQIAAHIQQSKVASASKLNAEAENALLNGVQTAKNAFGSKHPELGHLYLLLAELSAKNGSEQKAISYSEMAENALYLENNGLGIYLSALDMLRILAVRLEAGKNGKADPEKLKSKIMLVHSQLQKQYLPPSSQKLLRTYNQQLCAAALPYYLNNPEKGLFWAELSKKISKRSLLYTENRHPIYWGVPDSLLMIVRTSNLDKSELEKAIINAHRKNVASVTQLLEQWKLLDSKSESLLQLLKKQYPDYYNSFYNLNFNTDFSAKIPKGQTLLIFVEGEREYFRFVIVNGKVSLKILDKTAINTAVLSVFNALRSPQLSETFEKSSKTLYKLLVDDILKADIGQLMIVADGLLWNLPFEVLLTGETNNSYLINKLPIRYLWSGSEVLQISTAKGKDLSFFVSNYKNQPNNKKPEHQSSYKLAKAWAKELSVNKYRRFIYGDYQHNQHASESEFNTTNIGNFAALQLALYTEGDALNPMNSRILMSFLPDSLSDGVFYAHEIGKLRMPISLLSLSGPIDSLGFGDPAAAFLLAFSESGVESTLLPLWNPGDKATRILMLEYYKNLASGMSKSAALQEAKKKLIGDSKNGPHFWASYRLFGQDGIVNVRTRLRFSWIWLGFGGVLLIILLQLWRWKR